MVDLGVTPNGTVQLDVVSNDPDKAPLKPKMDKQELSSSDVITVRLVKGKCSCVFCKSQYAIEDCDYLLATIKKPAIKVLVPTLFILFS